MQRGIAVRGGKGVELWCDQHPDPLAEACRLQVCEAELIQAIGRGRGVNRTAKAPLDIDILADVVLPLTVDQVEEWAAPNKAWEMEAEGIWLESPTDMALAWPTLWGDAKAARDWKTTNSVESFYREQVSIGKLDSVRYQRVGPKQQWKEAHYSRDVLSDSRAWLEARLGPLAGFEGEVSAEAGRQPIQRVEVYLDVPGGRQVLLESFRVGAGAGVGDLLHEPRPQS